MEVSGNQSFLFTNILQNKSSQEENHTCLEWRCEMKIWKNFHFSLDYVFKLQCFKNAVYTTKLKENKNSHGAEWIYLFNMSIKISMATRGSKQGVMEWPGARGGLWSLWGWEDRKFIFYVFMTCVCVFVYLWGKGIPTLKTKSQIKHTHTHAQTPFHLQ